MTRSVLISINTSWNIYNFRASLVRALQAAKYPVVSAAPDDVYTPRVQAMVDRHIHLLMHNAGTSLLQDAMLFVRYVRLLREVKPAVMLTYTIKPNIYGALAASMCGVPVIANVSGLGTAFIRRNWLTRLVIQLYRLAFRRVACVFFQNAEDRDLFLRLRIVAPQKAELLPGSGVDLDYFRPQPSARPLDAPVAFVLIARLLRDKGIGEFVAAARAVKREHPAVLFRLVGPMGVQNQTAISQAQMTEWLAEGVIEYLGETDAVREVIAEHDCVVLPSYREGMSRVLLEAAAVGKPLIATDVPGCREVVTEGVNGFLCQAQNAEDLVRAMQQFLALTPLARAQMGAESRAKAEREFDHQQVIDAYLRKVNALVTG